MNVAAKAERIEETIGSRPVRLSQYYRQEAIGLRRYLNEQQQEDISKNVRRVFKDGAFGMWLGLVKREASRQVLKITHDEIGRKLFVTREAVSQWFGKWEIDAVHAWMLLRVHPRFHSLCTDLSLYSGGARHAINWIRIDVLCDDNVTKSMTADEFELLYFDCLNDPADGGGARAAFERLPKLVRRHFPQWDHELLQQARRDWRRAYLLFMSEMENEDVRL